MIRVQKVIAIIYFLLCIYMIGSLLGTGRYIIGNSLNSPLNESDYLGPENFSSLPRDAQLQDQQVSCFSEGTPTRLVMIRNSPWLSDPVPTWGMLGCEEKFPLRLISGLTSRSTALTPATVGRLHRSSQVDLFPPPSQFLCYEIYCRECGGHGKALSWAQGIHQCHPGRATWKRTLAFLDTSFLT